MNFTGTSYHTLDAKNRIFIPAGFREDLGDSFFSLRSPDGCIVLYNAERWRKISGEAAELVEKGLKPRDYKRKLMLKVAEISMDKQGRITLSDTLIKHAGLEKEVGIIGMDNCVEIWNADELRRIESEDDGDYDYNL